MQWRSASSRRQCLARDGPGDPAQSSLVYSQFKRVSDPCTTANANKKDFFKFLINRVFFSNGGNASRNDPRLIRYFTHLSGRRKLQWGRRAAELRPRRRWRTWTTPAGPPPLGLWTSQSTTWEHLSAAQKLKKINQRIKVKGGGALCSSVTLTCWGYTCCGNRACKSINKVIGMWEAK